MGYLLDLIKHFEGFRPEAYQDIVGVWTIGYGTTEIDGHGVNPGMVIDEPTAVEFVEYDLAVMWRQIAPKLRVTLAPCQKIALLDFAYNLGVKNLLTSTLLKKINRDPGDPSIQDEFERWHHAGGKDVAGLLRRRKAEAWMYFHNELKTDF